jgi:type II secretion system protein H
MILTTGSNRNRSSNRFAGFTLIELILVMALLIIVIAVAAPSLQGFFKGRNLDSEARRLLGLTHYGQSRAVSEGIPMLLWVDWKDKTYGLRAAAGYLLDDDKEIEFKLDRDLTIRAETPAVQTTLALRQDTVVGNLPAIRFLPDGSIADSSPFSIELIQGPKDRLWVGLSTNRLRYEIQKRDFWNQQR